MKIAIVHDFLVKLGGAERVVKVLQEIFPEADIYTLLYDEDKCGEVFNKAKIRTSFLQKFPKFIRKRYRLLLGLMPRAIENLDLAGYDLVISSSGAFSHGILTGVDTLHICYCHSPMRYSWDYTNEYKTENELKGLKLVIFNWLMKKIRIWDQASADRPDFYIANSENVKKGSQNILDRKVKSFIRHALLLISQQRIILITF